MNALERRRATARQPGIWSIPIIRAVITLIPSKQLSMEGMFTDSPTY